MHGNEMAVDGKLILSRFQHTTVNHLASHLAFPVGFQHAQFELAIVHEDRLSCFHIPGELHVIRVNNTLKSPSLCPCE